MRYVNADDAVAVPFALLMTKLAETLGARITESRIRNYAELFDDVPFEALSEAFKRAANALPHSFFPSPGEIRKFVAPSNDDLALLAWSSLGRMAETVGAYASVTFDDFAIGKSVVDVFGSWPAYCAMEDGPALALKRQEFLAAYRRAKMSGSYSWPAKLSGLCESLGGHVSDEIAERTWNARLTLTGDVVHERASRMLKAGRERKVLVEGADASDAQASEAGGGAGSRQSDPAAVRGEGRLLPPGGSEPRSVSRSERVGAPRRPPAVQDARPAAGGAPHDGGQPDALRRPPRRVRRERDDDSGTY